MAVHGELDAWLQRYENEFGSLLERQRPLAAEEFVAFVKNRGGSVSYAVAKPFLRQHDLQHRARKDCVATTEASVDMRSLQQPRRFVFDAVPQLLERVSGGAHSWEATVMNDHPTQRIPPPPPFPRPFDPARDEVWEATAIAHPTPQYGKSPAPVQLPAPFSVSSDVQMSGDGEGCIETSDPWQNFFPGGWGRTDTQHFLAEPGSAEHGQSKQSDGMGGGEFGSDTSEALQHDWFDDSLADEDGPWMPDRVTEYDKEFAHPFAETEVEPIPYEHAKMPGVDQHDANHLQDQEIQQLRMENQQLRQHNQDLVMQIEALHMPPAVCQTAAWIRDALPELLKFAATKPTGFHARIPILALRHTHRYVNAALAFGDGEGHQNSQESILKLFEQLFRGRVKPAEMEALQVKLPADVTDDRGIRSRNNRRLLALRALQSCRLDECIEVPCIAHSHQAYSSNANFKRWFDKGDDGDSGWSIYNREGQSKHRGVPIFNNAAAAVKGMKRLIARQENKPNPDWTRIHLAQDLLYTIKLRPVERANDEETLTFDADSRVGRSEWLQDEGDPWKQWDRDEGWHGHEQRHREDWNSRWRNQPEHGWNHQPRDENDPWEPGRPNDGHDGWDHQPRDENDPWKDWEPGRPNDGHDGWDHQLRDDHDPWRD